MADPDEARGPVNLGKVVAAHGVRGATKVVVFNQQTEVLEAGARLHLRHLGELREVAIERVAPTPGKPTWRVWFEGVNDRDAALALVGAQIEVERERLPDADADEFYLADVIGFRVEAEGVALGEVVGVTDNGAQDLLEVQWGPQHKTWLLPVLPQFLTEFDERGRRLVVDLPEGMLPAALEREVLDAR